jgi:hypothetical protein
MSKPLIEIPNRQRAAFAAKLAIGFSAIFLVIGLLTQNGELAFKGALALVCFGLFFAFVFVASKLSRKFRLKWK